MDIFKISRLFSQIRNIGRSSQLIPRFLHLVNSLNSYLFCYLARASLAVLEGFGEVVGFDDVSTIEVGDGSGELENAVEGTGG